MNRVESVQNVQKEETISILNWLGTIFLYTIPCVGLIVYIIWAFDKNANKNKSNYCKAMLIYSIVATIIAVVAILLTPYSI